MFWRVAGDFRNCKDKLTLFKNEQQMGQIQFVEKVGREYVMFKLRELVQQIGQIQFVEKVGREIVCTQRAGATEFDGKGGPIMFISL